MSRRPAQLNRFRVTMKDEFGPYAIALLETPCTCKFVHRSPDYCNWSRFNRALNQLALALSKVQGMKP
ncbi:hypothetical protein [Novosphingobium sp. CF614]|uniref:hypothetical protein n=1 Tax=Novosphingobium sp. CF614 TaxID=1884364 RepID=UPI00116063F5|nr:hypothetical protein [Novosphingobium sp. CF614]